MPIDIFCQSLHWQYAVSPSFRVLGVNRYLGPVVVYATYLRFPSRPNKISVEQRGCEGRRGNRKCYVIGAGIRMCPRAKFTFGRMYAGNRKPTANVITSGLTRLHWHVMHRALPHFLISCIFHISRWRRQSADLVLAPSLSPRWSSQRLGYCFRTAGSSPRDTTAEIQHLDAFRHSVIIAMGCESEKLFPDRQFQLASFFRANSLLTSSHVISRITRCRLLSSFNEVLRLPQRSLTKHKVSIHDTTDENR